MDKIKAFLIPIRDFLLRNLGLLLVVGGYLVPLVIFLIGIKLEWEHAFSPGEHGIDNKVLIWVISIPFWILMLTFIGQAVYYRMDTHREIKELKDVQERRLKEINEAHEKRINDIKSYSDIFHVIDEVNNKDIYASTIFSFLIEKLRRDLRSIKENNFIAEGWYWKLSNKFILHEDYALCTCILSHEQVNEIDIHEYFEEQYSAIEQSCFKLDRVLIVDSYSDLKNYSPFVSEQINRGVNFYILSKEFPELKGVDIATWNDGFKRDFALVGSNFLIEAKILNNDIRGYLINKTNGAVPVFAGNVLKYRKQVGELVEHFAIGKFNPVKDILEAKGVLKK